MISGAYQPIGLDDEGKVKSQLTPTATNVKCFKTSPQCIGDTYIKGRKTAY